MGSYISYVDNTIVDVYLDGKLVKSVQIAKSVSIPEGGSDIVFGTNWDAYFAKFERHSKATDLKSAYDKYMEGNGGSTLSQALGNMNVNLSITKTMLKQVDLHCFNHLEFLS